MPRPVSLPYLPHCANGVEAVQSGSVLIEEFVRKPKTEMAEIEQNIHINAPQLLSRRRRVGDALVTGVMWAAYSYLWAPLISLFAWLLGFEFAYDVIVRAGGIHSLKEILVIYSMLVACIFVVVAAWSFANRLRYSGQHDRRKGAEPVSDAEIATYFDIDDDQLRVMRESQVVNVDLSELGAIESVEAGDLQRRPD